MLLTLVPRRGGCASNGVLDAAFFETGGTIKGSKNDKPYTYGKT